MSPTAEKTPASEQVRSLSYAELTKGEKKTHAEIEEIGTVKLVVNVRKVFKKAGLVALDTVQDDGARLADRYDAAVQLILACVPWWDYPKPLEQQTFEDDFDFWQISQIVEALTSTDEVGEANGSR